MARPRTHRLKITGTLEAVAPLHVGGMRDSVETDMPLARDGQGRWYVPGTSLAGPMRAWVEERFDEVLAQQIFGHQNPTGDGGYASFLTVEDACVTLPNGLSEEIWDGVGIDRQWGVAADGIKYDRAILPKGTTFDLQVTVELPPADQKQSASGADPQAIRAVIGHLLEALENGHIGFGAARTRGFGNVQLKGLQCKILEEDWSSKQGILNFLGDQRVELKPHDLMYASSSTNPTRERRQVRFRIVWKPDGPVMVKAGQDGVAVDMLPMVSGVEANKLGMVLAGSSIKGVLRSQAERIVRTVLNSDPLPQWDDLKNRERHLHQVDEPLVREVFGLAKRRVEAVPDLEKRGNRGALEVDTCYARDARLEPAQWREIAQARSDEGQERPGRSPLYDAIHQAGLHESNPPNAQPYLQQAFHVAVDRWTGSAADGFLYSTLEPFNVTWDEIVLTLDLDFLSARIPSKEVEWQRDELCKAAVVLLLLLARDLAMSRIPLGFAGNRGYGSIKVEQVHVEVEGVDWMKPTTLTELGGGQLTEVTTLDQLQQAWSSWITAHHEVQKGSVVS